MRKRDVCLSVQKRNDKSYLDARAWWWSAISKLPGASNFTVTKVTSLIWEITQMFLSKVYCIIVHNKQPTISMNNVTLYTCVCQIVTRR